MYQLVSSKSIQLTPRNAPTFSKMNTFDGQRPKSPEWIQTLAGEIKAKRFTKASIAVAYNSNDVRILMNGQQTCDAVVLAGEAVPATLDTYHFDNKDDLWHLFGTFDVNRQRTERHVMKAAKGLFASKELRDVPLDVLASCGSALLWLGGGTKPSFKAKALNKAQKAELVKKYEEDVHRVNRYRQFGYIPVSVATAIIATTRKNSGKAIEFWEDVCSGDQLKRGAPEWWLNQFIVGRSKHPGFGGSRNINEFKVCVAWWNHFIGGTTRSRQINPLTMETIPDVKG